MGRYLSTLGLLAALASACSAKRSQPPAPKPGASQARVAAPAPPSLRRRIYPLRPVDDREPAEQCRAALTLAAEAEQGAPGALERLEPLEDPLARALLALLWFRQGKTADATEARAVLAERVPAADPAQPPLVQHLQLVQSTLDHCADLKPIPDAACGLFAEYPAEALNAFRRSESSYAEVPALQIAHQCVPRVLKLTDAKQTARIARALSDVPAAYFAAANAAKMSDPRAIEQAVFEVLALGLIQPQRAAPDEDARALLEDQVRVARPAFLTKLKQAAALRTSQAIFSPALLDSARKAALTLAAQPDPANCGALYYGIGVPRDLPAARRCYEQLDPQNYERQRMLVVMMTNGQGGPRHLAEAKAILDRADYRSADTFMRDWRNAIEERLAEPQRVFPEVNFCDQAFTTVDMDECGSIRLTLAEQEAHQETAQLRVALNPAAQNALDQLEASAKLARKRDGDRAYYEHIDGTMRGMYGIGQQSYVLERQQLRLRRWIRDHAIDPTTPADLSKAEQALAQELRVRLAPGRWTSIFGFPSPAPQQAQSQRAWLAYRDAWLRLLHALPAPGAPPTLPDVGLRTVLTRERLEELKLNDQN